SPKSLVGRGVTPRAQTWAARRPAFLAGREVPADKGYSSVEDVEAVTRVGATPTSAFKSSATGASGGLREKAFHFYSLHREEFLAHYHKRSNVESAFSMIKAKFRDSVRSK